LIAAWAFSDCYSFLLAALAVRAASGLVGTPVQRCRLPFPVWRRLLALQGIFAGLLLTVRREAGWAGRYAF